MNRLGITTFLRRIPSFLFCILLGAAAATFSSRLIIPKMVHGRLLAQTPFRQILSGGAEEILGTPPPPPQTDFRKRIQWETQQNYPFHVPLLEAANSYVRWSRWNVQLLEGDGPSSKFDAGHGFICEASWASRLDSSLENERLLTLMHALKSQTKNTLFVAEPPRIPHENHSWAGVFDFSAEMLANRVRFLNQAGIPVLDLSTLPENTNIYFRTDHHMTIEAGLATARALAERLSVEFGIPIDRKALGDDSFDVRILHGAFLGSYGEQVTIARCRPDDFPIITSKPPSRFKVQIPSKGMDIEGDGAILLKGTMIATNASYRINQYAAYGYGNPALLRIRNLSRPDGPCLLVFSDSFDNACITFLANAVSEIVDVDLRYYEGTLDDVFKGRSFDAVIVFKHIPDTMQLASLLKPNVNPTTDIR